MLPHRLFITLQDHIAFSVTNLDAWIAKPRAENVTFLEQPHVLGDTRAVMIEGQAGKSWNWSK